MLDLELDIEDVEDAEETAVAKLAGVPAKMHRIVARAGEAERRTHPWTNRTYRLEHSTRGVLKIVGGDEVAADVEMTMHYASYVRDKGYSSVDRHVSMASKEMQRMFDELSAEIGEL